MALTEATSGQRDGHAGEHHAQAACQQKKALGSLQRLAKARLPLVHIQQPLPFAELRLQPALEALDGSGLPGI